MTSQPTPPVEPEPGDDPARRGEDLAALLERLLSASQGRTQKDLASEAGISYPTLNAWMNRTRGTSRIDPEKLRAMVEVFRRWGVRTTPREFFEAVGRPVPGPSRDEREARLLKLYRQLPEARQRALLKDAEAMLQVSRIT
ncbi:helix-turn-helix transcriptional regulator [Streptomyces luteolifulvus]|uniref:Helix-turn-helix transcriptional regulator n=1 Tax=Streptomyces luteolifulvus TaxID=2615112 RepID=A0A6H9US49_9ACTN|nr:helix-turn-helix transcriptional regulator [Streptomyces luteolifulvus]KAB1142059.1 helix-turn-helix transcriptional regulator [Streptomyces luteolifulvus]